MTLTVFFFWALRLNPPASCLNAVVIPFQCSGRRNNPRAPGTGRWQSREKRSRRVRSGSNGTECRRDVCLPSSHQSWEDRHQWGWGAVRSRAGEHWRTTHSKEWRWDICLVGAVGDRAMAGLLGTPVNITCLATPSAPLQLRGDAKRPAASPCWFNHTIHHPVNKLISPGTFESLLTTLSFFCIKEA